MPRWRSTIELLWQPSGLQEYLISTTYSIQGLSFQAVELCETSGRVRIRDRVRKAQSTLFSIIATLLKADTI